MSSADRAGPAADEAPRIRREDSGDSPQEGRGEEPHGARHQDGNEGRGEVGAAGEEVCDGHGASKEPFNPVAALEAVLFAAGEPVPLARLAEALEMPEPLVEAAAQRLAEKHRGEDSGIELRQVARGYQFTTRPRWGRTVGRLLQTRRPGLSHAALETLAVIAFRQPVTRAEIEQVRGVNCERALQTLAERELIHGVGRRASPGRPILYGTTRKFLTHFGMDSLEDLPEVFPVPGAETAGDSPGPSPSSTAN